MKKIIPFFILFLTTVLTKAQNICQSSHPLFSFNENAKPKPIHELGSSPQIDFLRNLHTPNQFIKAIKQNRNSKKYKKDIKELNEILTLIGFQKGLDDPDFTETSLSYDKIPYGTVGNLGDNAEHYEYSILLPNNINGIMGWKIKSPSNCFVFVFTKCGNLFYPKPNIICPEKPCPCREVTLNINTTSDHVDVTSTQTQDTIINSYYICYKGKVSQRQQQQRGKSLRSSNNTEECILLYADTTIVNSFNSIAVSYDISASMIKTLEICKDTTIDITLNLNERQASSEHNDRNHFINKSVSKTVIKNQHSIIIRSEEFVGKKTFQNLRLLDKQKR